MRRRIFLITFALTTMIVIAAAWFFQPPPHLLMDKAVQIPGVHLGYRGDEYQWLSPDELLVFRPAGALQWTVYDRDIQTGVETPMPALTRLLHQTGGDPDSVKIAPDHSRLLWAGIGKWIYGATLAGNEFQQWAYGPDEVGYSYWLGDSRRFVRYAGDRFADPRPVILRDIAATSRVRRLPLHWSQDKVTRGQLTALLATQRPQVRVYAEMGSEGSDQRDAYVTVSIMRPVGVHEETAEVPLPPGFFRDDRSDSYRTSDGQVLLWTLGSLDVSHQPGWVQRLTAHLWRHPKPTYTVGLYASRADGLGWRFVGDWQEPVQLDYYEQRGEKAPGYFRWVPGDRRISFEYAGGLYLVPAG